MQQEDGHAIAHGRVGGAAIAHADQRDRGSSCTSSKAARPLARASPAVSRATIWKVDGSLPVAAEGQHRPAQHHLAQQGRGTGERRQQAEAMRIAGTHGARGGVPPERLAQRRGFSLQPAGAVLVLARAQGGRRARTQRRTREIARRRLQDLAGRRRPSRAPPARRRAPARSRARDLRAGRPQVLVPFAERAADVAAGRGASPSAARRLSSASSCSAPSAGGPAPANGESSASAIRMAAAAFDQAAHEADGAASEPAACCSRMV